MKKIFIALTLLSLWGAQFTPALADDVSRGKAPFMTDLRSGQKFYATRAHHVRLHPGGSGRFLPSGPTIWGRRAQTRVY